jgi:hypothetical protein
MNNSFDKRMQSGSSVSPDDLKRSLTLARSSPWVSRSLFSEGALWSILTSS